MIFIVVAMVAFDLAAAAGSAVDDGRWLQQLYTATGGGGWHSYCSSGWDMTAGANPCSGSPWSQVLCNNNERVYKIELYSCNLRGTLPELDSTGAMSQLQHMYLYDNHLQSTLPSSWSRLSCLQGAYLYSNYLSGALPESWASLSRVQYVDLSGNQLSGPLPTTWQSLSALQRLNVSTNELSGALPESWSSLANLQMMDLSYNQLTGGCPPSWVRGLGNLSDSDLQLQSNCLDIDGIPMADLSWWKGKSDGGRYLEPQHSNCSVMMCAANRSFIAGRCRSFLSVTDSVGKKYFSIELRSPTASSSGTSSHSIAPSLGSRVVHEDSFPRSTTPFTATATTMTSSSMSGQASTSRRTSSALGSYSMPRMLYASLSCSLTPPASSRAESARSLPPTPFYTPSVSTTRNAALVERSRLLRPSSYVSSSLTVPSRSTPSSLWFPNEPSASPSLFRLWSSKAAPWSVALVTQSRSPPGIDNGSRPDAPRGSTVTNNIASSFNIVSGFLGGAAGSATSLAAIDLLECGSSIFPTIDNIVHGDSPLNFLISPWRRLGLLPALIGNVLTVVTIYALHCCVVAATVPTSSNLAAETSSCHRLLVVFLQWHTSLRGPSSAWVLPSCATMRFPAMPLRVAATLLPGTSLLSFGVAAQADSVGSTVAGLVGVSFIAAAQAALFRIVAVHVLPVCHVCAVSSSLDSTGSRHIGLQLLDLAAPRVEWVPAAVSQACGPLLNDAIDATAAQLLLVQVLLLNAVVSGLAGLAAATTSRLACSSMSALMGMLHAAAAVWYVTRRPFSSPIDGVMVPLHSVLICVLCCMTAASIERPESLKLLQSLVAVFQLLLKLLTVALLRQRVTAQGGDVTLDDKDPRDVEGTICQDEEGTTRQGSAQQQVSLDEVYNAPVICFLEPTPVAAEQDEYDSTMMWLWGGRLGHHTTTSMLLQDW